MRFLATLIARFIATCLTSAFFKTFLPEPLTDTDRRTMKEIEKVIQTDMLLDDLLFHVKGIPIVGDDCVRFILADSHR
jgi:hypothetical protein